MKLLLFLLFPITIFAQQPLQHWKPQDTSTLRNAINALAAAQAGFLTQTQANDLYAPINQPATQLTGVYRTIAEANGSHIAGRAANKYWIPKGEALGVTGTGTLYPPTIIYISAADFPTVDGKAALLRLRVVLTVNDVAPTGNFTFGLYPITRPGTSGGAGLNIYTVGNIVNGSTVLFTAPAADAMVTGTSTDFALPADGYYVLAVQTSAAVATSSLVHVNVQLQTRNQ